MPANFIIFIGIAQLIIILGHYIVYKAAVLLFVVQSAKALWALRYIIALLSICFLPATIYTRYQNTIVSQTFYQLAATWMGMFVYAFIASVLIILLYSATTFFDISFNWRLYGYAVAGAALFLVGYGIINAQIIQVKRVDVSLANLPQKWKGKSFVFLSDTHFGQVRNTGFAKKLVAKIDALQPEFVLHGGDFFDGVDTDFKSVTAIFAKAKTKQGIYFATGNHESFEDESSKYTNPMKESGIHVLNNEEVTIDGLTIIGAEYAKTEDSEQFKQFLTSLHLDPSKPSILIKHVPNSVDVAANAGVSLMLSGHTHQGQVWPFRYITHKLFKGFDYGLKSLNAMQEYTSSGAGTWGPPMRVFTSSEIVYITFT